MSSMSCTAILATTLWMTGLAVTPAQQGVVKAKLSTATYSITAIDQATRSITLRDEKGQSDTYIADPSVQRFNELKVGQKVKVSYYESVVFQVRKPGDPADASSYDAALARAKEGLPAATVRTRQNITVTVKSVDMNVGSITVATEDGTIATRHVDKANLTGIKAGDRITINYVQAVAASILPEK
jgi:Cu/Ag efflux protein CusF